MTTHSCSCPLMRRLRPTGDAGLGLSEILIAMVLLAMVGGSVVAVFTRSTDSIQRSDLRNRANQQLTVALESMTRTLRSTYRLERDDSVFLGRDQEFRTGDPEMTTRGTSSGVETAFYANVGDPNGPTLVHWYVDTQLRLIEERTAADPPSTAYHGWRHNTMPVRRRVLLEHVVMPSVGSRPLFSWFGPSSSTRLNDNDPYRPLAQETLRSLIGVQINLTVRPPLPKAVAVTMEAFTQIVDDLQQLTTAPNWPTPPRDDTPVSTEICTACGGMPAERTELADTSTGGDGGSTVTGPVAGLA